MRIDERSGRQVLWRVRLHAGGGRRPSAARRASCFDAAVGGASARVGSLRRPRWLHRALRGPRRGGGSGVALDLLRHGATADRALRRHRREVHRRCRDGGLGSAHRDGGRRRTGRPRRARARLRSRSSRRCRGRVQPPGAGRGADRRGCGDARRCGRGNGRGRSRQHRVTCAVGCGARRGVRRRRDEARDGGRGRLRERGRPYAEGESRTGGTVARGTSGRGAPGWKAVRRPRGAVRRARAGVPDA